MSSPVYPRPAQSDEINIMGAAVKVARFVRKHLVWAILFPALGLFGGYLNNLVKGPTYEGDLMIRTRVLRSEELTFLIGNYERAKYPGLTKEERRSIRGLKFKATKGDPYIFGKVTCILTDTTLFKKMQGSIAGYIESQPSVRATTKNINDANSALIAEYTTTIRKAELLLDQREVDPTLAYKNYRNIPDLTLLYDKRREIEIARRDSTAIVIVSDLTHRAQSFKKPMSLIIGFFIGIMAAAVMLFIIHFVDYYRKNEETAS